MLVPPKYQVNHLEDIFCPKVHLVEKAKAQITQQPLNIKT